MSLLKVAAGMSAAAVIALYLTGYFFLWSIRVPLRQATPLTAVRYAVWYGHRPEIRRRLFASGVLGVGLTLLPAMALLRAPRASLHGDARFARAFEIRRAGLFARRGIFLGRRGRRYLILGGEQGAIVSAPPRSDKGTAIVVPNCLLWDDSLICQDIKLENWTLTAGFRARAGQACYLVSPLDPNGHTACVNPLAYVSSDPNLRISGVQRIGATLFPEIPGTDPFWTAGGRGLFLGMALYVLETPSLPPTLGEVLRQGMASDAEGFSAHWKRIIAGRQRGAHPLSPQCVRAISDVMDLAPVTASSIRKTFTSRLDLFANPLIDAATSRNDFDWRDLRRKPMSVYLGIQPGDLHLLRPLLNLFLEQAIALQTETLPEHDATSKHQVLMLLDETVAPGRIPILAQAISYLPGYNVRLLLVIQAYSQLRDTYGANAADTMMKSLGARVLYAPKDFAEAEEISRELGFRTVKVKTWSKPVMDLSDPRGRRGTSLNVSEQKRALLLPQEVKTLGRDREILLCENVRPILARKNRYYQDRFFRKRLLPPPLEAAPHGGHAPLPRVSAPGMPADAEREERGVAREAPEPDAARKVPSADVLERLEEFELDELDKDLSRVDIATQPQGERMTEAELKHAVDSFMLTLQGG